MDLLCTHLFLSQQQVNSQTAKISMCSEHSKSYPTGKFEGENFSVWKAKFEAYLKTLKKDYVLSESKPRRILQGEKEVIAAREEEIKKYEEDDASVISILLCSL